MIKEMLPVNYIMAITLIDTPRFVFTPGQRQFKIFTIENVTKAGIKAFCTLRLAINCYIESSWQVLPQALQVYKVFVIQPLGDMRYIASGARAALFILATAATIACVALWILGQTVHKLYCHYQDAKTMVKVEIFCNKLGLNEQHFRSYRTKLSTREVPANITIQRLLTVFDEINFDNPTHPGYFPPLALKDEGKPIARADLRSGLQTFISRVANREPFVGTPPAHERRSLSGFYQQIEDAVRVVLFTLLSELEISKKEGLKSTFYQNALENLGRFVIDIAIASRLCGARYMGEAMSMHDIYRGGFERGVGTLDYHLTELLAEERKRIVLGQILPKEQNAHDYTLKLSRLGRMLGLPHTENIVESIKTNFDLRHELESFFRIYKRDHIIQIVQTEFKTSQDFREKFVEWVKSQMGGWAYESYKIDQAILEQLRNALVEREVSMDEETKLLDLFMECYNSFLTHSDKVFSANTPWKDVLDEIFSDEQVKTLLRQKFKDPLARRKIENLLTLKLCEDTIGQECTAALRTHSAENQEKSCKLLRSAWEKSKRASNAQKILPLPRHSLLSVIDLKADLKDVYEAYLEREREASFLEALQIEHLSTNGANASVIDWLLISHGILASKA